MSAKNSEGKRAARERLAVERERQAAAHRRRRTLLALLSVVGVLAVAGIAAAVVTNSKDDGRGSPQAYPRGVTGKDRLAILDGKSGAPATLTVYEDFRCPACAAFEKGFSKTIHELVDSGQLKTEYRLVTLIDGNLGGEGSLRSANAAACASDRGRFRAYHDVLYANQPPETDDAFADNGKLLDLAKTAGGLDGAAFRKCVDDGTYDSWVKRSDNAFRDSGHSGTPTVLLDGKNIYGQGSDLTPDRLKSLVAEAGKA
ncbi:hypothetical protein SRB5_60280 [Streptomyces sp. RB5]|uniref:Thioredoxin-like fold domain-containing protein n=1 Tax=Streptomyces smaragdinus TaxID=2585196 RepID=A0A7K0CQS7_9ACTN|nr:thioredoxin domain-containing protein [Streptomyces smaragdinus]MQY15837.1 hypothetical protein [Streptomyces smaragdinus]